MEAKAVTASFLLSGCLESKSDYTAEKGEEK